MSIGESVSRGEIYSERQTGGGDSISSLRRFLVRLALDADDPSSVIERATRAITEATASPCSFLEGCDVPDAAPGHVIVPVHSSGRVVGALLVASSGMTLAGMSRHDIQEIADLVGLGLINGMQTQAVTELQDESEDMLFHAPDAIFVLSLEGAVQMANRRALDFVSAESDDVVGRFFNEIIGASSLTADKLAQAAVRCETLEVEIHSSAGSRLASLNLSLVGDGAPGHILCVVRDITTQTQAQLALRLSERNVLMGQAVSYLLHEVNNPLAAMIANVSYVKKRGAEITASLDDILSLDSKGGDAPSSIASNAVKEKLEQVNNAVGQAENAASRIRETMAKLRLAYSRQAASGLDQVDVAYELTLAIRGIEKECNQEIAIQRHVELKSSIDAVPLRLAEAFGAVLKNAYQALEEKSDGEIWVRAEEKKDTIRIAIRDNGPGIPPLISKQIFMPFFTTKSLGKALGLGLTMADDLIRAINGRVTVNSTPGEGTEFVITIPCSKS